MRPSLHLVTAAITRRRRAINHFNQLDFAARRVSLGSRLLIGMKVGTCEPESQCTRSELPWEIERGNWQPGDRRRTVPCGRVDRAPSQTIESNGTFRKQSSAEYRCTGVARVSPIVDQAVPTEHTANSEDESQTGTGVGWCANGRNHAGRGKDLQAD